MKRNPPTNLRMNSINAVIRHVFRANDHDEKIPPVIFVDALPSAVLQDILSDAGADHWENVFVNDGIANPSDMADAVAAAYPNAKIKNIGRILVLRSAYEAMTPEERQLTIAHEACHFVVAQDERFRGAHCEEWRIAMERAGYEEEAAAYDPVLRAFAAAIEARRVAQGAAR